MLIYQILTENKGALIIYLEGGGGAMMILRGVTFFPYYDLGGAVENFQQK